MELQNYIKNNNIKQINISNSIKEHENWFFNNIKYEKYINNKDNTLFWGVYNSEDVEKIINHNGNSWIYWYDNDCNPNYEVRRNNVNKIKLVNIKEHLCSNNVARKYLRKQNIKFNFISLSYENSYDLESSSKYSQTAVSNLSDNFSYESHIYSEINNEGTQIEINNDDSNIENSTKIEIEQKSCNDYEVNYNNNCTKNIIENKVFYLKYMSIFLLGCLTGMGAIILHNNI